MEQCFSRILNLGGWEMNPVIFLTAKTYTHQLKIFMADVIHKCYSPITKFNNKHIFFIVTHFKFHRMCYNTF